jgi:hypothetical protein
MDCLARAAVAVDFNPEFQRAPRPSRPSEKTNAPRPIKRVPLAIRWQLQWLSDAKSSAKFLTAALLVIGGLSGRTKDQNISYVAEYLSAADGRR